jgi:hypothetical protein
MEALTRYKGIGKGIKLSNTKFGMRFWKNMQNKK